jgi:broad specificity phosphatase PhoE
MGKILLIRHGKAGFGENDYDQLSDVGKYQAQITGHFFKQADIQPTRIYSGTLKRQKSTAEIACVHAGFSSEIQMDSIYNEYDYQGIIDCLLPGLIADNPSINDDLNKAFSDYPTFERIFSMLLTRWISKAYDSNDIESFDAYTRRVIQGIDHIADNTNDDDITLVFTSGGLIAVSLHLILSIPPISALKLGWSIYNCSITSFYASNQKYRLETFNSVAHLQMNSRDGIVTLI